MPKQIIGIKIKNILTFLNLFVFINFESFLTYKISLDQFEQKNNA